MVTGETETLEPCIKKKKKRKNKTFKSAPLCFGHDFDQYLLEREKALAFYDDPYSRYASKKKNSAENEDEPWLKWG